jgi:predicted Zn-dependent peptidase
VLGLVVAELRELREKGPGAEEVRVACEHLKGSLMLSLESTSSRMSNLARQEIYHRRRYGLDEALAGIARVTPEAVHRTARRLFEGAQPALAVVGRTRKLGLRAEALRP